MDRIEELLQKVKRIYNPQYLAFLKAQRDAEVVYSEDTGKHETRLGKRRRKQRARSSEYRERHPEIDKARQLLKREMTKVRKKSATTSDLAKYLTFLLSHDVCYWCKKRIPDDTNKTIDHVIPLSTGGTNSPENLVLSCKPCNQSKINKNIYVWVQEVLDDPNKAFQATSGSPPSASPEAPEG